VVPADQAVAASGFEHAVLNGINQVRSSHGLGGLSPSGRLSAAASRHSRRQIRAGRLGHDLGGSPLQRLSGGNNRRVGETIALVSRQSPGRVISMWMNSASHRAVLLTPGFRRVGIGARRGRIAGSRGIVVTADFGG
jgi:uncharacterized protein YkwD